MGAFGSGIVVISAGGVTTSMAGLLGKYVNPAKTTQGVIYISKGERWDTIAFKMYGDASQLSALILANPGIPALDYVEQGAGVFVPLLTPTANTTASTPWG